MLVQCPNCKITYKVSDDVVKGASPAFRCSRCKHTFELQAADTSPPATEEPAVDRPSIANDFEDREPKFSFPSPADTDKLPEQPELPELDTKPQTLAASHNHDEAWPKPVQSRREEPSVSAPHPLQDTGPSTHPVARQRSPRGYRFSPKARDELLDNVLEIEPYRDEQASTVPSDLVRLLVVLFPCRSLLPSPSERFGRHGLADPADRPSVLKNNHLHNVSCSILAGKLQMIQGNREVFIVSGTAVNRNPVVIRKVAWRTNF